MYIRCKKYRFSPKNTFSSNAYNDKILFFKLLYFILIVLIFMDSRQTLKTKII